MRPAWLEEGKVMSAGFSERMKDKCLAGSTPLLGRVSRSGPNSGQGRKWLKQEDAAAEFGEMTGRSPQVFGSPSLRAFGRESCPEGSSPALPPREGTSSPLAWPPRPPLSQLIPLLSKCSLLLWRIGRPGETDPAHLGLSGVGVITATLNTGSKTTL